MVPTSPPPGAAVRFCGQRPREPPLIYAQASAASRSRIETIPISWPSRLVTGRWRTPRTSMRWTTALASCSTLAVCGADDAYAATPDVGGVTRPSDRPDQAAFGDDANQPLAVDHGQRSELCLVHPTSCHLQAVVDVDGEQSRLASVLDSHVSLLGDDPPSYAAWRTTGRLGGSSVPHHGHLPVISGPSTSWHTADCASSCYRRPWSSWFGLRPSLIPAASRRLSVKRRQARTVRVIDGRAAAHVARTRRPGGSAYRRQTPVGVGQRLSCRCAVPCHERPQRTVRATATTTSERWMALNYRRSEARDFPTNVLGAG